MIYTSRADIMKLYKEQKEMAINLDPVFNLDVLKQMDSAIDHAIKDIRRVPKPTKKKDKKTNEKKEKETKDKMPDFNLDDLKDMDFSNLNLEGDQLEKMKEQLRKMKENLGDNLNEEDKAGED